MPNRLALHPLAGDRDIAGLRLGGQYPVDGPVHRILRVRARTNTRDNKCGYIAGDGLISLPVSSMKSSSVMPSTYSLSYSIAR